MNNWPKEAQMWFLGGGMVGVFILLLTAILTTAHLLELFICGRPKRRTALPCPNETNITGQCIKAHGNCVTKEECDRRIKDNE